MVEPTTAHELFLALRDWVPYIIVISIFVVITMAASVGILLWLVFGKAK